jgi:hypothetical protein
MNIPARMYTSEVLALAKWKCTSTLRKRQKEGRFPAPVDRGREMIFNGRDVYQALGLIDNAAPAVKEDPIMKALELI